MSGRGSGSVYVGGGLGGERAGAVLGLRFEVWRGRVRLLSSGSNLNAPSRSQWALPR